MSGDRESPTYDLAAAATAAAAALKERRRLRRRNVVRIDRAVCK